MASIKPSSTALPRSTPSLSTSFSESQIKQAYARNQLRGFLHYVSPAFNYAWDARHVRLLCDRLMAVERGDIKRLMVFMPPRHRKSQTANAHFSAWYLGRHPDHHVITASYGSDLANTFSRQSRNLIGMYGEELFGVQLSSDSHAVNDWALADHYGGLTAAGVGGALTGRGANLLILDDLFKDAEEANSATIREKVWEWYTHVAATRIEPDGKMVLITTRWHPDDVAGRLLKAQELGEGDQWDVIRLSAEAETDDLLDRQPGEALWPEEFPLAWLQAQRRRIGSHAYTALYQQRPQELHGGAFQARWFHWYTADRVSVREGVWYFDDQPLRVVMGVDLATTAKTTSDDFALCVVGLTPTFQIIVLDITAEPMPIGEQAPFIVEQYRQWAPDGIFVEDNAGQAYFVDQLKKWHKQVPGMTPLPVRGKTSVGHKYDRIVRNVPWTEAGLVFLRSVRPDQDGWVDLDRLPDVKMHRRMVKLYQQLVTLNPAMEHDDACDAWDLAISATRMQKWFDQMTEED